MKVLGIRLTFKRLLLVSVLLFFVTIFAYSNKVIFKGYLPHNLSHGYQFIPVFFLVLSILSTVFLISTLNIIGFLKVIIVALLVPFQIILIPFLGSLSEKPFAKIYFEINSRHFNDLIGIIKKDSISTISVYWDNSIKAIGRSNRLIQDPELDKLTRRLNFKHVRANEDILILYDYSSRSGFGYFFSISKTSSIQSSLKTNRKIKKVKINENISYFNY